MTDTKQEAPELLPCPFCSAHAHTRETKVHGALPVYWVECVICEIGTKYHDTASGAAQVWNTRVRAIRKEKG